MKNKKFNTIEELIEYIRPEGLAAVLTDDYCIGCMSEEKTVNTVMLPLYDDEIKGILLPICQSCAIFVENNEKPEANLRLQKNALETVDTGKGTLIA